VTERCVATHWQRSSAAAAGADAGGIARNTNKEMENMSRGHVCPMLSMMQSNRQLQSTQLRYHKSVPKGPNTQLDESPFNHGYRDFQDFEMIHIFSSLPLKIRTNLENKIFKPLFAGGSDVTTAFGSDLGVKN
jgi:hypothetical protein